MNRTIPALLTLLLLTGCAAFSPESRPVSPVELPPRYSMYAEGEEGPGNWWEAFESSELNTLVETALSGNFDLREAWARLKQAKAKAVQAGAGLSPALDLDSDYTHRKQYSQSSRDAHHVYTESDTYSLGLAASYELDLWGKLASRSEVEHLNALASREDVEAAATSVAASVTETWTDLLATREEIRILEKQIETNQMLVDLQELRFANSMASALDVSQQREILAGTKAEMPLLKARERVSLNALAVLTGVSPGKVPEISQKELPAPVPLPETGLPAGLLAARPDVRAAGLRLKSADWEISVARADRLPSLTLSARAAFESGHADLLFSNWLASLTAGLTGPIFDAGYRKAEVERTRAVAEERLAAYGNTVLAAVQEVEDNMVNEMRQREYIAGLEEKLAITRQALSEARLRYLMGQSDYLPFLTELLNAQSLERTLVRERATLIKYRVGLYRALGGDWTGRMTPEGLATTGMNGRTAG